MLEMAVRGEYSHARRGFLHRGGHAGRAILGPAMPRRAPSSRPLPRLLDRRLVFVTGKGGVGKSTIASALGVLAAAHGRRTIVAELARRDDVTRTLGHEGTRVGGSANGAAAEYELAGGLHVISIDPERALEEYLADQLPVKALADVLTSSRTFTYLAAATPGLSELLAIGKVWELAQPERRTPGAEPYDLVVVDAPATGHGVAFLTAPGTFAAAAAVGPIARQARRIHGMIVDPQATAIVAVARPTEASVVETIALRDALASELGRDIERVIVNGVEPRRFGATDDTLLAAAEPGATALTSSALRAARHAHARARAQQAQVAQLRRHGPGSPVTLPQLFADAIGPAEVERLARLLEARL